MMTGMTKPRLTAEEHAEIGRQLAQMQRDMVRLQVQLSNAYPRTGIEAEPLRTIEAVENALRTARHALEDALYRDHRPPVANTDVYSSQA